MSYTWLVTGSSSGFGRAVTEAALKRGDRVVATLRKPSDLDDLVQSLQADAADRLLVLKCDVTKSSDIASAFAQGTVKWGSIDIVFNNAGYGIQAEVESTPENAARQMFDVNFWGASNVSKEAIRVFREVNGKEKGGWLFNVSSGAGLLGLPASGYYCASKFALEGLTESLAKEIDPSWNIKITLIELGGFRTRAHQSSYVKFPPIPAYSNEALPSNFIRRLFDDINNIKGDVIKAADRILEVTSLKDKRDAKIPLHWVVEKDNISNVRDRLKGVLGEVDEFEHWSDNLLLSDEAAVVIGK